MKKLNYKFFLILSVSFSLSILSNPHQLRKLQEQQMDIRAHTTIEDVINALQYKKDLSISMQVDVYIPKPLEINSKVSIQMNAYDISVKNSSININKDGELILDGNLNSPQVSHIISNNTQLFYVKEGKLTIKGDIVFESKDRELIFADGGQIELEGNIIYGLIVGVPNQIEVHIGVYLMRNSLMRINGLVTLNAISRTIIARESNIKIGENADSNINITSINGFAISAINGTNISFSSHVEINSKTNAIYLDSNKSKVEINSYNIKLISPNYQTCMVFNKLSNLYINENNSKSSCLIKSNLIPNGILTIDNNYCNDSVFKKNEFYLVGDGDDKNNEIKDKSSLTIYNDGENTLIMENYGTNINENITNITIQYSNKTKNIEPFYFIKSINPQYFIIEDKGTVVSLKFNKKVKNLKEIHLIKMNSEHFRPKIIKGDDLIIEDKEIVKIILRKSYMLYGLYKVLPIFKDNIDNLYYENSENCQIKVENSLKVSSVVIDDTLSYERNSSNNIGLLKDFVINKLNIFLDYDINEERIKIINSKKFSFNYTIDKNKKNKIIVSIYETMPKLNDDISFTLIDNINNKEINLINLKIQKILKINYSDDGKNKGNVIISLFYNTKLNYIQEIELIDINTNTTSKIVLGYKLEYDEDNNSIKFKIKKKDNLYNKYFIKTVFKNNILSYIDYDNILDIKTNFAPYSNNGSHSIILLFILGIIVLGIIYLCIIRKVKIKRLFNVDEEKEVIIK